MHGYIVQKPSLAHTKNGHGHTPTYRTAARTENHPQATVQNDRSEARPLPTPRTPIVLCYASPPQSGSGGVRCDRVRESETVRVRDHSISPFALLPPPARFFQRGERGRGGSLQQQREKERGSKAKANRSQLAPPRPAPPCLPEFSISPRRQKKAAFGGNLLEHCGGERDLPRRASCCSGPAAPACHWPLLLICAAGRRAAATAAAAPIACPCSLPKQQAQSPIPHHPQATPNYCTVHCRPRASATQSYASMHALAFCGFPRAAPTAGE